MAKVVALIALAAVISAVVVCRPHWLSENAFLRDFVNHEVLALMAVVLTVTLASVANIHIALNRIVARRFGGNVDLKRAAGEVKREMKDNAWYIFWGFVLTIVVLLVKGLNTNDQLIVAISNGAVVWVLFLFILCMHDIYKVIFGIVDLEMEVGADQSDGEDYTSESPEVGQD
ncbi:hypothetical protein QO034_12410 [Sedimentitalea sp. JM2-8]|uniref:Uncharacterized protein n=1 Tax=Sedimentitalea xiamensis TaxID=3050037 RepID=A0ABT7FFK9_9RHOB|nr:hypothetical protein [Sedimentitalea xiamensis]MDK3073916.1 hypothetical protein [Sedimentitalea xiamensis]